MNQPPPSSAAPGPPPDAPAPEPEPEIDLFCPGCGYDLRALQGEACPECGAEIDLDKLRATGIPWVLGAGLLGKAWGFYRTCDRAGLRPTRFCREVAKPVSLHDGRQFRGLMVVLVWSTLLATAAADWFFFRFQSQNRRHNDWEYFFDETGIDPAWLIGSMTVLLLVFLIGFTGMHLYAMHPRSLSTERQNRAVALGHYACAPLGAYPFILLLRLCGASLATYGDMASVLWIQDFGMAVWAVTWLLLPVPVLLFLRCTYVFAGRAAHRSGMAQAGMVLGLPLLWLGWGLLVFIALPAALFFVYLFFLTW